MAVDDAEFRQKMRQFEQQAARAAGLKDQIAQLQGSARNSDGSVTVTVAPSGAVLGMQLSPGAMTMTHTQLTQEILGTIRRATQQAAAAVEDTVRPVLGDEMYDQFQDAFRAHAPAVQPVGPSDPPPPANLPIPGTPPARSPRPAPPDDDYFDDGFPGVKR